MSRWFFDRARMFAKRLFDRATSTPRPRRVERTRLTLEALEERTLLSAFAAEPLPPSQLTMVERYVAQESLPYIRGYDSILATLQQRVENIEYPFLLAASRVESTTWLMIQQFMAQALFSTSPQGSASVQSSFTYSGQTGGQNSIEQASNDDPLATPGALLDSTDGPSPAGSPGQPAGFSPQQISQAYGFNQIYFSNGAIKGDGSGQTIAIVDAYNQPNIDSDLQGFDTMYGLPAPPSFSVVNQSGGSTLPAANTDWGLEESLDVEWAHAMAPGANIVLVEANSNSYSDLMTAVNYARTQPGVSVVSMSWGSSEFGGESSYDSNFTTPSGHDGVTFVASTGDNGSSGAPEYPSVSPNVLAVGGTQLSTDSAGDYQSETGWSGSGGGISAYESQPRYQTGVVAQSSTLLAVPDVSYNASSASPFAVYDSTGYGGWIEVYGTSGGVPQWSALVAIADQGRAVNGEGTLDGPSQTLPALYQMPSSNFHDITTGSNGAYSAGPGYDLVTGLGTPIANLVVNSLVSYDSSYWQDVNLSGYYNQLGIASTSFSGGGLDGNGDALIVSANIDWQGNLIPLGPHYGNYGNNVVSSNGQTITLPTGAYSSLTILAEAVNGNQVNQPFTVTYTNGLSQTFDQSLTNWLSFPSYPNEQRAEQMSYYRNANGTEVAGPDYMSAFVLPLNLTLQVKSITLPNDSNVEVLGMLLD
ncbi:MAG: S53 family peptidase [Gemmataceae bacterium]